MGVANLDATSRRVRSSHVGMVHDVRLKRADPEERLEHVLFDRERKRRALGDALGEGSTGVPRSRTANAKT